MPAPTPPVVACPTPACTSTSLGAVHKVMPGVAETPLPSPPTQDKQEALHPPYEHKCIRSTPSAAPSRPAPSTCARLLSARTLCADGRVNSHLKMKRDIAGARGILRTETYSGSQWHPQTTTVKQKSWSRGHPAKQEPMASSNNDGRREKIAFRRSAGKIVPGAKGILLKKRSAGASHILKQQSVC